MKTSIAELIKQKLEAAFSPSELEVIDESHQHAGHAGAREEGESHFAVTITSSAFEGLSRVASHKLVYAALDEEIKGGVHALRINTLIPKKINSAT